MDRAPEGLPWLLPRAQWLEPVSRLIAPGSPGPPPPPSSVNLAVVVASWPTGWVVPFRPTARVPDLAAPPPSSNATALQTILTVWNTPQIARLQREIILSSGPLPSPPPPYTRSTVEWSVWTNYESWIDLPVIGQAIEPPLPPTTSWAWLPTVLRAWDAPPMPLLPRRDIPLSGPAVTPPPVVSLAPLTSILTVWNTPLLSRLQRDIILASGPTPSLPPPLVRSTVEWSNWTNYEPWIDFLTVQQAIEPPLPPSYSWAWLATVLRAWEPVLLPQLPRLGIPKSGIAPDQPPTASLANLYAVLTNWNTAQLQRLRRNVSLISGSQPPPPGGPFDNFVVPIRRHKRR